MTRRRHLAKALAGVKPGTVLDHYTERYGVHKGAIAAAHMAQIAATVIEYGRDFTNEQYMELWAVSERTAWAHRAEAVEVYGDGWRDVGAELARLMEREHTRALGKALQLRLRTRARPAA